MGSQVCRCGAGPAQARGRPSLRPFLLRWFWNRALWPCPSPASWPVLRAPRTSPSKSAVTTL